jgi:nucleoside-diphosphate-sugar epimerase
MSRKALVLGGGGFIGSHLLKYLSSTGEYDLLVSGDIKKPRFDVPGVQYKTIDVCQPIPDDVCPGCTEIYNLAAVHTTPGHEDWEYYWTNVLGATHACDFARRQGVNQIVFTSSIAVYAPTEDPLDEDVDCKPISAYGRSKFAAEKIHKLWQAEQPETRKLVVIRPGVIYGYTERGNFTRLAKLLPKKRFAYPGRKDTIKSCGYVKDLVRSFRFVLDLQKPVITYNFCHPNRYTSEDICNAFSRVAGFPVANRVLPLSLMLTAGRVFEIASKLGLKTSINRARVMKLNRSTNIIPKNLTQMQFNFQYDLDSSLKDWQATSSGGNFD